MNFISRYRRSKFFGPARLAAALFVLGTSYSVASATTFKVVTPSNDKTTLIAE